MYIAGLDIHDVLRRSPLTHSQGVEGIVWLTTLAAVVRAARRHAKGAHHPNTRHQFSTDVGKTGILSPPSLTGTNIGHKPAPPLLVKIISPVAHGVIMGLPLVYLAGTAWCKLYQPEWFSNWALPDVDALSFGQLATLRTVACAINYGALYLWKRASYEMRRAVCFNVFFHCLYTPLGSLLTPICDSLWAPRSTSRKKAPTAWFGIP